MRRFQDNRTQIQLLAVAHNLANFLRELALPRSAQTWTLTTFREKSTKIGAKVVHRRAGGDVPTGRGGGASGVIYGDPGSDRSAASRAEARVIVRRGRMRVTSSRGAWDGLPCGEDRWRRDEPNWVVGTPGRALTLPTAPNLAVFPWTLERGRCPMRVQESWARSRRTKSTLIWEIPVDKRLRRFETSAGVWHPLDIGLRLLRPRDKHRRNELRGILEVRCLDATLLLESHSLFV